MEYELETARSYLEQAESELRGIIISAVNGGSYDVVTRLTDLSAKVRQLIETLPSPVAAPLLATGDRDEQEPLSHAEHRSGPRSSNEDDGKAKRASKGTEDGYPRFLIRDDQLVKLGWSSSSDKEYEHRVPRSGLDAFIEYVGSLRRSRFPVTAEAIAKGIQKSDSQRILGYQVYVVAAWLKSLDLLRSEGRQGYFIPDGMNWPEAVGAAWDTLVQKSGHP
jgi:hypothetical protein